MSNRKRRTADYIKEAYSALREGEVVSIENTSDGDDGSLTKLLISAGDTSVRLKIGRGTMQNWR